MRVKQLHIEQSKTYQNLHPREDIQTTTLAEWIINYNHLSVIVCKCTKLKMQHHQHKA